MVRDLLAEGCRLRQNSLRCLVEPIHVEAKAVLENKPVSETSKIDLSHAKFGGGFAQRDSFGGTLYDYSLNNDYSSAEAAAEIEKLLIQLQSQGYSPENAKQKVASDLATQAKSDSASKRKLTRWGQYLGDTAANGIIGDGAVEVIKLALRLAGIPVP